MKTALKIVVGLLVLLVIAAVVAFVFLRSNADTIAERLIERGGTRALGVETTVDAAKVGLGDGSLAIDGLAVANPPIGAGAGEAGYASERFLTLENGAVSIDPRTIADAVRGGTAVIPELTLSGITVNLERVGGASNYRQILDNLGAFEKGGEPAPPEEGGANVVVRRLTLSDITVNARYNPGPGLGALAGQVAEIADVSVSVPEITLTDIGTAEPISVAELTGVVVKALLEASANAAGEQLPGDLRETLRNQLANLRPLSELGIGGLEDLGAVGERVRDAAEQLREGVEGFLGRPGGEREPDGADGDRR